MVRFSSLQQTSPRLSVSLPDVCLLAERNWDCGLTRWVYPLAPPTADVQASTHADALADLLLGANAELGQASSERDGLTGQLEGVRAELEASQQAVRAAAQARADVMDLQAAELVAVESQRDSAREEGLKATERAELDARTAVAQAAASAAEAADLRVALDASKAELTAMTDELERCRAGAPRADQASQIGQTADLADQVSQTEQEETAALSPLPLVNADGDAAADPVSTEARSFICFRGFRVGDRVLFRKKSRGGTSVYAALVAGSLNIYLDCRQVRLPTPLLVFFYNESRPG